MKTIKDAVKDIAGNIREAREKINRAYEMMEENRAYADWQKEMAAQHLAFNARGHEIVKKMIADAAQSTDPLAPGMKAAYQSVHADLVRESAEVKAMVDGYGK